MARRSSNGGAPAAPRTVQPGDVPTTTLGKTGVTVSIIAQCGAHARIGGDAVAAGGGHDGSVRGGDVTAITDILPVPPPSLLHQLCT